MDIMKTHEPEKNPTVHGSVSSPLESPLRDEEIPDLVAFGQAFHLYYPQTKSKRISKTKKCGDSATRLMNIFIFCHGLSCFYYVDNDTPGYLKCRHPAIGYHVFDGRLHYTLLIPLQALNQLTASWRYPKPYPKKIMISFGRSYHKTWQTPPQNGWLRTRSSWIMRTPNT